MRRKAVLSTVLVAIILTSGCIGPRDAAVSQPDSSHNTSSLTPTTTTTKIQTPLPSKTTQEMREGPGITESDLGINLLELDPDEFLSEFGVAAPDEGRLTVREEIEMLYMLSTYFDYLPKDPSERRNATIELARIICENNQQTQIVLENVKNNASIEQSELYQLKHTIELVNEHQGKNFETEAIDDLIERNRWATKYLPLAASYNNLVDKACLVVEREDDESIEDFYIASAFFGLELFLIQNQVFFKTSFAATRLVSNKAGMYRIGQIAGNKAWALTMSETHWAIRGEQRDLLNYIQEKSYEAEVDISDLELTREKLNKWHTSLEILNALYSGDSEINLEDITSDPKIGEISNFTKRIANESVSGDAIKNGSKRLNKEIDNFRNQLVIP